MISKNSLFKIGKVLVKAYFNGDTISLVNNIEGEKEICMEDVLSVFDLEEYTPDEFEEDDYIDLAMYIMEDKAPKCECENCNELRIRKKDTESYILIWAFNSNECKVFVKEIREYLRLSNPEEDEKLLSLIKAFNEKFEEAQDARSEVMDYLAETYGIDTDEEYDTIEDNLTWVYGIDVDRVKKLISKEEG